MKVTVFTGSRAEYGLLRRLISLLARDVRFETRILASGSHLAAAYGATIGEVLKDSFCPLDEIDADLSDNSNAGIAAAAGRGLELYGKYFSEYKPDLLVLLGDRYEAFAAAAAAVINQVPVAHICGGEISEGAIDNTFRHAITKMSQLHFTASDNYRRRVIQMGEEPERVFNVGNLGGENALCIPQAGAAEVRDFLALPRDSRFVLATWHPVTLGSSDPVREVRQVLAALRSFPHIFYVFTGANADAGGQAINDFLQAEALVDERLRFFMSLGVKKYIQAARQAELVLGNSSSGVCEIPFLGVPVLDIGDRQKGRDRAEGVRHCETCESEIRENLRKILQHELPPASGEELSIHRNVSEKIRDLILANIHNLDLKKKFFDIAEF